MMIKRETLEAAASAGMLKYAQIDNLLVFLAQEELKKSRSSDSGRFNAALLYTVGGLFALGAAAVFAVLAIGALGIGAMLWFAVLYGLCAVGVSQWCAQRGMGFVASMFALIAVVLTGAAMFAYLHLQADWRGGLEMLWRLGVVGTGEPRVLAILGAALATALTLLIWLRLPFLVLPIAALVWLAGLEIVPAMLLHSNSLTLIGLAATMADIGHVFSVLLGLGLITAGLFIDWTRRPVDEGFAFWAYFSGLLAFGAGLMHLAAGTWLGVALFIVVQLGLVAAGMVLGRRLFEAFGILGVALILGHATWQIFHQSEVFVWILTAQNLAVLAIAAWWWKSRAAWVERLPRGLRNWRRVSFS